jgi:hypothetical protein
MDDEKTSRYISGWFFVLNKIKGGKNAMPLE